MAYLPDGTTIRMGAKTITISRTENWYGREETSGVSLDVKHLDVLIKALSDLQRQHSYDNW